MPRQFYKSREFRAYAAPAMLIRFTKTRNGFALTCTRDDGSVTTSKPKHGQFFLLHDLMHYCVESTLHYDKAFFGLIAAGQSIESFSAPASGKSLPDQAVHAEHIIAAIQQRQQWSGTFDADEINREVAAALQHDRTGRPASQPMTQPQIDAIVSRHHELTSAFAGLEAGKFIELRFALDRR